MKKKKLFRHPIRCLHDAMLWWQMMYVLQAPSKQEAKLAMTFNLSSKRMKEFFFSIYIWQTFFFFFGKEQKHVIYFSSTSAPRTHPFFFPSQSFKMSQPWWMTNLKRTFAYTTLMPHMRIPTAEGLSRRNNVYTGARGMSWQIISHMCLVVHRKALS